MRDLEKRLHEGYRSENLDQQIITGEADLETHNCALSRSTWAAEGATETPQGHPLVTKGTTTSHPKAIC